MGLFRQSQSWIGLSKINKIFHISQDQGTDLKRIVLPILTNGCETWRFTADVFE